MGKTLVACPSCGENKIDDGNELCSKCRKTGYEWWERENEIISINMLKKKIDGMFLKSIADYNKENDPTPISSMSVVATLWNGEQTTAVRAMIDGKLHKITNKAQRRGNVTMKEIDDMFKKLRADVESMIGGNG